MKLNGALKPRHGASSEGSSPGVVQLRKYRDKRYPKDTYKHVANDCLPQQLSQQPEQQHQLSNECGANVNNKKDDVVPNKKTEQLKQEQLQEFRRYQQQREEISLRKDIQGIQRNKRTSATNNNSVTATTPTEIRLKSAPAARTTTETTRFKVTPPTTATIAVAEMGGIGNHPNNNNNKKNGLIQSNQIQQDNITTRPNLNRKNSGNGSNQNNCSNSENRKTPTVPKNSGMGGEFPIANYHVTSPNMRKTESNSGNTTAAVSRPPIHWKEVNKLSLVRRIYESVFWRAFIFLTVTISQLFTQFKLFLFSITFFMFSNEIIAASWYGRASSGEKNGHSGCGANVMRVSKSFMKSYKSRLSPHSAASSIAVYLLAYGAAVSVLLPPLVLADDGDNFFSPNGIAIGEQTTTEFDYASRGEKKFGDKCDNTLECGFPGSICDTKKKSCQCTEDLPVTNHIDKCGKEAAVNESCFFNEQCEVKYFQTECRDGRCVCRFDMSPIWLKDGSVECKGRDKKGPETYIDPAMIGVLIGMALMFIIICVVLRLFSQARWRENRTIFNTPNPRLMNVSLLRESKLLHGQERRGSRMSVRAPSRQPSMVSLRPHSPNPSLGKTGSRSNSHGSNASATSLRSTRSNSVSPAINNAHHERKGSTYRPHPQPQHQHQHQHHQHQHHHQEQTQTQQPNIIANPVAESVTVEIIEPEK